MPAAGPAGKGRSTAGRQLTRSAPWRVGLAAACLIAVRLAAYAVLAPDGLVRDLCRWDCDWYVSVAAGGYDRAPHLVGGLMQANWAFFPFYPIAMRAATALTGISLPAAGVAMATIGLFGFALLGWLYRARTRPGASPWSWLLLLIAWPYGFYFNAPYSESFYAALVVACLLAMTAGRPWLAAAGSALLTATRPTGFLLAGWFGLDRLWRAVRARSPAEAVRLLAPAILAPLGLAAFMAFLWWHVGDAFAFAHIQSAWGHTLRNPLMVLLDTVRAADPRTGGHVGLLYDVGWALCGLVAGGVLLVRRHSAEAWLCAATVMMALLSGVVWSMPRFVAANPVFLFAAADMFDAIPGRIVRGILLIAMAVMQVVFLFAWFRGASYLM